MGNLATPIRVQKLQAALHAKAKAEAGYRFYALYDKVSRDDILAHAYAQCRANKGAPGVDGQVFAAVESYGVRRWLGELALALREETYRPDPIRRVFIPKANGKLRPLGISTLRDRVCMTAAMLVLDPIFEADLPPEQYAYRRGRNAQQAVVKVEETLFRGRPDVVDADLADYFGSIPHAEMMLSLARRIVDPRVLHLIKMWLECSVEEDGGRGRTSRTTVPMPACRWPVASPIAIGSTTAAVFRSTTCRGTSGRRIAVRLSARWLRKEYPLEHTNDSMALQGAGILHHRDQAVVSGDQQVSKITDDDTVIVAVIQPSVCRFDSAVWRRSPCGESPNRAWKARWN